MVMNLYSKNEENGAQEQQKKHQNDHNDRKQNCIKNNFKLKYSVSDNLKLNHDSCVTVSSDIGDYLKNIKMKNNCQILMNKKNNLKLNNNNISTNKFNVNNNKNKKKLFNNIKHKNFNSFTIFLLIFVILLNKLDNGYYVNCTEIIQNSLNYQPSKASDFSRCTIIQPKLHHGKHKRELTTTQEKDGLHASHITLSYDHHDKNIIIDLQLNYDLIPDGHYISYQTPNGGQVRKNFTKTDVNLCHYQGAIRGIKDSSVAVSTCDDGIDGIVFDGKNTYHIQSGKDGKIHSDHYLYNHADMTHGATCGYEGGINENFDPDYHKDSEFNRILRYKRSASSSDPLVRGPYNSNKDSSYVELVLVIDNKVYKSMGENITKVHQHSKNLVNIINSLYVPLNIFITLVGVVVWTENNEAELSSNGDKTLQNFLIYRRQTLIKHHPNDNAQLLTKEQFEGGVVGKALKGPICTYEFSGGVSMDHSSVISVVATTMAHEMGHNFGMEHDSDDCKCVDDRCIMSASSSAVSPKHWSSCSIDQLNLAFHHGMNYCLKNKPTKLFDSPTCGNGIVEPGEQCDCGLPEVCDNSCCDPHTCMLHSNASCATGECCDLSTCRPRAAGFACRGSNGECDLPEYCTGESEYCPKDVFKRDTESCGDGKAYCYQGSCRSHTDQCKVLWGLSGKSSDQCYTKNTEANFYGNCGYDKLTNSYTPCEEEDILCGMLHCRHLNEKLEFGMESVSIVAHNFINHNGNIIPCRTAIVDLGLQVKDPGLTPDGAKCGENKMCVNKKCMSIDSLRASGKGIACLDNCNGNGVCNSNGNCHCEVGFAPPFCKNPGPGGSIDSGPASSIQEHSGFFKVILIFFLGVVPTMLLIVFGVFYWRNNRGLGGRKPSNVLISNSKHGPSRNAPSPPTHPASTPSSPDDMNSALLKTSADEPSLTNNNMFGKFKGFTLKPLPKANGPNLTANNVAYVTPVAKTTDDISITVVPNRLAPPVPKPPNVSRSQTQNKPVKPVVTRNNTTAGVNRPNMLNNAPALPPLNPGANPRPIISSPILETSTCTAKELLSPLKNNSKYPIRSAPTVPVHTTQINTATLKRANTTPEAEKKPKEGTLHRIASFLKLEDKLDKKSSTLTRNPSTKRSISIDKDKLKNIEISAPIPQSSPDNEAANRISLNRTQSMRDSAVQKRPNIQTFGSMRQPSDAKRPKSLVGATRPKSPPPPRPPAPPAVTGMNGIKIPSVPCYQNPPTPKKVISQNDYDDCEAVEVPLAHISEENSPTSDNIYAVIDENPHPVKAEHIFPPISNNTSLGLLGEIVSEIENRNFDSIYSASTLKKKKKSSDAETSEPSYANTSDIHEDSDEEYSNMNPKSNASTTSSGYLRPSAINTPIARVAPTKFDAASYSVPANHLSSFKSDTNTVKKIVNPISDISKKDTVIINSLDKKTIGYKPYNSSRQGPFSSMYNNKEEKSSKEKETTANVKPVLSRTVTPPTLKSNNIISLRKRSPSPKQHKNLLKTTNSNSKTTPDLVTSMTKTKPPDIVTNGIQSKPKTPQKPSSVPNKNDLNKLNRQNSGDKLLNNKSRWQSNNQTTNNTQSNNLTTKTQDLNKTNSNKLLNDKISNNSDTVIGKSVNLSKTNKSATRPLTTSKPSNVASLQQKFENGNSKLSSSSKK